MIRVPASSIAAPATSAANAQNYEMKKDLDAISGASIDDLGFMTGITGSSGSFALGADIRSRASETANHLYGGVCWFQSKSPLVNFMP